MTAVNNVLADAECEVNDIDVFAVAAGPGSFTGIRIGVAACAAMAHAAGKPAVAVNTLEALIKNAGRFGSIVSVSYTHLRRHYACCSRGGYGRKGRRRSSRLWRRCGCRNGV